MSPVRTASKKMSPRALAAFSLKFLNPTSSDQRSLYNVVLQYKKMIIPLVFVWSFLVIGVFVLVGRIPLHQVEPFCSFLIFNIFRPFKKESSQNHLMHRPFLQKYASSASVPSCKCSINSRQLVFSTDSPGTSPGTGFWRSAFWRRQLFLKASASFSGDSFFWTGFFFRSERPLPGAGKIVATSK